MICRARLPRLFLAGAALLSAIILHAAASGLNASRDTQADARPKTTGSERHAQALLFDPSASAGSASGPSIWLANGSLVATWDTSRGGLRLASLYDRKGGRPVPRTGDAFSVALGDGTAIRSTELRIVEPPRVQDTLQRPGGPSTATLSAGLESSDGRIAATWRASLSDEADYVRQELTVRPARGAAISSLTLIDVEARDPKVTSTEPGSPAIGGGAFFFVEHADSRCAVAEGRVRCTLAPPARAGSNAPLTVSWVIGLARPDALADAMRAYASREGDIVPSSFKAAVSKLVAATPAAAPAQAPSSAGRKTPVAVVAGPYLQRPGQAEVTVMWITDRPAAAWVEYGTGEEPRGESLPSGAIRAVTVSDGLVEAGGRIHRIRLTGLQPDTTYWYRIVSREIEDYGPYKVDYGRPVYGMPARFRTLSNTPKEISFVVLNDLHEDVDVMKAHLDRAMAAPPDLVFFNGDSLSHIESDEQIVDRLLAPASRLLDGRVPLLLVRGNHETRGRNARRLPDHLALPEGRYYHSLTHGPVHFIVLDCGEDKEDTHWAYSGLTSFDDYRRRQAEWLREEVRSEAFRSARFRVLVSHMPFFGNEGTNVSGHGPSQCRESWGDVLNEAGLDLHIAGHTHRSNWVPPATGANTFPVLVGGSSARGANTMIRVDVSGDRMDLTVTEDDGEVIRRETIRARR